MSVACIERAIELTGEMSPSKGRQYRNFLNKLKPCIERRGGIELVTREDIEALMDEMHWSVATRNQAASAFRWLKTVCELDWPAVEGIRAHRPRLPEDTFFLDEATMNYIESLPVEQFSGEWMIATRTKAMFMFVRDTLAAVEEIEIARREDLSGDWFTYRLRGMPDNQVRLRGRTVALLDDLSRQAKDRGVSGPLFPSTQKARPLSQSAIHRAMSRILLPHIPAKSYARAGVGVSMIRASEARSRLLKGASIDDVTRQMGAQDSDAVRTELCWDR